MSIIITSAVAHYCFNSWSAREHQLAEESEKEKRVREEYKYLVHGLGAATILITNNNRLHFIVVYLVYIARERHRQDDPGTTNYCIVLYIPSNHQNRSYQWLFICECAMVAGLFMCDTCSAIIDYVCTSHVLACLHVFLYIPGQLLHTVTHYCYTLLLPVQLQSSQLITISIFLWYTCLTSLKRF